MQDWEKRDLLRKIGNWIDVFFLIMKILLVTLGVIYLFVLMVATTSVIEGNGDKTIKEVFHIG